MKLFSKIFDEKNDSTYSIEKWVNQNNLADNVISIVITQYNEWIVFYKSENEIDTDEND